MIGGKAAGTGIVGRGVGDDRSARRDDMPEKRVQVSKFHALRRVLVVELARLVVPGDVGQGRGS